MADLLDAFHFMFEDDLAPSTGEQQEARMKNRERIYVGMYGRPSYEWAVDSQGSDTAPAAATPFGKDASGHDLPALDKSIELEHKDYIPPTEFNPDAAKPFGDILDAPLG